MIQVAIVNFKGHRVRVRLTDQKFLSAHIPGDNMDITSELSNKDKLILEFRALSKVIKKEMK
jgi:hypothetical protein